MGEEDDLGRRQHSQEQVVRGLREADRLLGEGTPLVEVSERGHTVNPESIRYLNRLSDLCWLYARWIETKAGLA